MRESLERVKRAANRYLRGPAFSKVLTSCGIDPKRYWLLMDLFAKLSQRNEMQGQLGRQTASLRFSAGMFFLISSVGSVIMVALGMRMRVFIAIYMVYTLFILLGILLSETANSLMNPVEGLALAHQPINGATYTGAKLSHLLRVVFYFVAGVNLAPSVVGLFLREAPWFYPVLYFVGALSGGLVLAISCCGLFGWLMGTIPARRLKATAQFVQGLPFILIVTRRAWSPVFSAMWSRIEGPLQIVPLWAVVVVGAGVIGAAVIVGLRSLSADYLIQASVMVHSGSHLKRKTRPSLLGDVVRRYFGGQPGRAGFEYMRSMMMRDWQFRRQLLSIIPLFLFVGAGFVNAVVSNTPSPFAAGFSPAHMLPHVIGVLLLMMCRFLQYGTDYKGIWLFLIVPDHALYRFAQGVHASLWLTFLLIPHALLTGVFIWRWGIADTALFLAYSAGASSIYLAAGLNRIDGVPFGKQVNPSPAAGMQLEMLLTILLVGIALGIQWLIFRSHLGVAVLTPIICAVAYILTRLSLSRFDLSIRHNLAVESGASKLLYTEAET
jgi:hypothetical protein